MNLIAKTEARNQTLCEDVVSSFFFALATLTSISLSCAEQLKLM